MNLVIKGKCTSSYAAVHKDFMKLSETRAQCCDESKTIISKIDEHNFIVLMFDVDMSKLKELLSTPENWELFLSRGDVTKLKSPRTMTFSRWFSEILFDDEYIYDIMFGCLGFP